MIALSIKRCWWTFSLGLVLLFFPMARVDAHDIRPTYLEFNETLPDTFDVIWKVPANSNGVRPDLNLVLPSDSQIVNPSHAELDGNTRVERSRIHRSGGLDGASIRIDGLENTTTEVLVRVENLDGASRVLRLSPSEPSVKLRVGQGRLEGIGAYFRLGVDHILRGVDHLLFVLGLLLIVRQAGRLVKTITAFTLAHSMTLAAATFGWVHVSLPPLNACIALSIFFLGPEIVRQWRGETSLTIRKPWLVAFAFGLMHGFGFATGLSATGVPSGELPIALLCFNLGVEFGQLVFVLIILLLVWSWRRLEIVWPVWVARAPGYAIGVLGAFWTIQRTLLMFGLAS